MKSKNQISDNKDNRGRNVNNNENANKSMSNTSSNKVVLNLNAIINNLKTSLENFDSSIRELKMNMDKDKEEKNRKIKDLENSFNSKLNSIIENQSYTKSNSNVISNGNGINVSPESINEILSKLNYLEQKSEQMESDINNKFSQNKRINDYVQENDYSSRTYKKSVDTPLNKNIENFIKQKIGETLDRKMKLIDEKIQILNSKVINLEIRSQNKTQERNDNSINDEAISKKFDKKIEKLNQKINNKFILFADKLGIDDLEDMDLDHSDENNDDNDDEEKMQAINEENFKELEDKLINEMNNKFKIFYDDMNNKIKSYIDNKFNDIKNETGFSLNKANEKTNNTEINNLNIRISSLKSELLKLIEARNNNFETKIKNIDNKSNKLIIDNQSCLDKVNSLETKLKSIDNKIRLIDNKFANISSDSLINNNLLITPTKNNFNTDSDQKNSILNSSINMVSDKTFELDSVILNKDDFADNSFLFSKIKETFPYDMSIKYKLIYRCSKHGDSAKNFHIKCDYIGPNMVLVKTKKNFIFGGVTAKSWKHLLKDVKKDDPEYGTEIKDEKAFGFSINLKKIYKNGKPNEFAIFCNNNYGPVFKNIYFKIFDECLKNGGICGKIEESNFIEQEKDYEFNGEEENFEIEDIEVFQIGFR
jgi:hypothetical protein